jgi:hypothetical protein
MRDVATLVWVVLIIVGVVSSIISSVRKQVQSTSGPRLQRTVGRRPQFWQPPAAAQAPAPPPSASRPPRPKQAPVVPHFVAEPARHRPHFFGRKGDIVRAVIASEVLGKPKALTDEPFRY